MASALAYGAAHFSKKALDFFHKKATHGLGIDGAGLRRFGGEQLQGAIPNQARFAGIVDLKSA
jgi:hypothetical protein